MEGGCAGFTPGVNYQAVFRTYGGGAYPVIYRCRLGEAMTEPNLLLDALIEAAGLSRAGLAVRLNTADRHFRYDHASVARWIRDGAIPRHPVPDLICQILGERLGRTLLLADIAMARKIGSTSESTLDHTVAKAKAMWRADHHDQAATALKQPITGPAAVAPLFEWENPPPDIDISHDGRRLVGHDDITNILAVRAHYEQMYRRVGGVPVRTRLISHLTSKITPMLDGRYDHTTGRALYRAVGGLVAIAGVCSYDAQRQAAAQRYFFYALRMAKASGDKAFGGYVVALLTNQAICLRDFRLAIQYAETALRAGKGALSPALRTDLHAMQAKSYARIGDPTGSRQQMRLAETAAQQIVADNEPSETSYVQPGLVEVQHSEALRRIGDLETAQTYAEQAVQAASHTRGHVHRLATLSLVLTARKQIERSVAVAGQAFADANGMESWRIHDRLTTVAARLRPYDDLQVVREFLDSARTSLTTPL